MRIKDWFVVRPQQNKEGYIITCGPNLATDEVFETEKKAQAQINKTNWELVTALAHEIVSYYGTHPEELQKLAEKRAKLQAEVKEIENNE